MSFIHLHNHSHYSILEWLPKPADYVKKALEFEMKWVALTDTGNIYGCHEFYKSAKDSWVKPILWAEIFVESPFDTKLSHKLVLLAKNYDGYKNIIELITYSNIYSQSWARVNFETLKSLSHNIICLSWPISWEIAYFILMGKSDDEIGKRIQWYQSVFWVENYFLEILEHKDIPKQDLVSSRIIELHKKYHIPLVATNNCYYIEKEDKTTQDIIMSLWTGHEVENPDRNTLMNWDYSFLSPSEMAKIFWHIPESLENTLKILDSIDIKIDTGKSLMPVFEIGEKEKNMYEEFKEKISKEKDIRKISSDEFFLRYLCFSWMDYRYDIKFSEDEIFEFVKKTNVKWLEKELQDTEPDELRVIPKKYFTQKKKSFLEKYDAHTIDIIDRLEYELFVVHKMGFDAYFLIVSDYINWAKTNWIPVGPWRWSAAWSILAYLSWITDLDPLQYDLLFERFLNPARISMPDIDTDFSDDGRDRVVDYCRKKYGEDRVVQICTFWTFAARAAVKDVGRVMWVAFSEMNEIAKLIPEKPWTKLKWALESSPEFKNLYDKDEKVKKIISEALKIEGNVRQIWVHACAVIIAPEKLTHFTALQYPPKDNSTIITQYSAYPLEDLWLLKMDFLGLRNLTIVKRALKIIKRVKEVEFDILKIPLDDSNVFQVFAQGDTTWVFQFESSGMRSWLKILKPTDINDIIAMVSLYRPWPMQFIQNYIDRKYGKEKIHYMYEELEEILRKKYGEATVEDEKRKLHEDLSPFMDITYGIAVYQEQLMRLVQAMAWFSLAEADMLRRWVGKKKKDVIKKIKIEFIKKAEEYRGYKPETSEMIYEKMITPASDYSFNKSHAACYAFIAYETAYLKAYYQTEFLTSLMVSDEENTDRIALEVQEVKSKNINILPPSVQESLKHFTYIDDKNIRFWLKAIKWLWNTPIEKIISVRNNLEWKTFSNIEEFILLTWKEVINKKSLEALIKSWSLDELWDRWILLSNIDEIIRFMRASENKKEVLQIGLFDMDESYKDILMFKNTKMMTYEEKLFWEKEVLGFMVSGHPLDGLKRYIEKRSNYNKMFKFSFDKIKELEFKIKNEKEKKNFDDSLKWFSIFIWVVVDIRKIITKTGKNMAFILCESFEFDFEGVLYEKEYNEFFHQIKLGNIIMLEGFASIDIQYEKKTIQIKKMKIMTLSQIREQAKETNLYDNSARKLFSEKVDLPQEWEKIIMDNVDKWQKIMSWMEQNEEVILLQEEESFTINIPLSSSKKDLLDLKEFLYSEKEWQIKIYINFKWQEIDTKTSISSLNNLKKWIIDRWNIE